MGDQEKNKDSDTKKFIEYLEKATKEVESWPEWKRNVLGKIFRENDQKIKGLNDYYEQ